ncbi:hypothetical protein BST81_24405 [Leptolyngbya sp. 'hensonii']|uniref:hypothetical protein n=1 Tax=Leptolyngbya sp. 'hensonii' TaxID=1922337 RepID=UPI00094FFD5E|nr:hypothetical protein [Leptolyngbya sp. 'hensonii']OLP15766.1 hypothetical protein BST81_24405 [Leptolyngbya sp. 'hensonii']
MSTVTRSKSRAVHRSTLEQAESFLKDLPKKEKDHLPIVEAINQVAPSVRAALAKGYSYTEVAALLSEQLGISVSAWSLRRYVPSGRRGKQSEAAEAVPKRPRRKKQEDGNGDASIAAVEAIAAQQVALEQPEISAVIPVIETEIPTTGRTRAGQSRTNKATESATAKPQRRSTATAKTTRSSSTRPGGTQRKTTKGK